MEQKPNDQPSTRTAAIALLVGVSAGVGVGYAILLATGSNVLGMGMASSVALLGNNFVLSLLRRDMK